MKEKPKDLNLDQKVIDGFGHEWSSFDYTESQSSEALDRQFAAYCSPLDLSKFNSSESVVADFGAGSGRWSSRLLSNFLKVYALEPSDGANSVLLKKFKDESRVIVLKETVGANSIPEDSLDLGIALGVLHHIPDTGLAISDIASKIKPGGCFLCYLYYRLEDKPSYYRAIFKIVDFSRQIISRLPQPVKRFVSSILAGLIYWPLARLSKVLGKIGVNTSNIPLHHYSDMPYVMLANDALDRFGTSLEQRFNKTEIKEMLAKADFDLSTLVFSEAEPFWAFSVQKKI